MSFDPDLNVIEERRRNSLNFAYVAYSTDQYNDLVDVVENPPSGVTEVIVSTETINQLIVVICGPKDSPYENGVFDLKIKLPNDPNSPPSVYFLTRIYHPSIDHKGNLDIGLFHRWTPGNRLRDVLINVLEAMRLPDLLYPLNVKAYFHYRHNYPTFFCKAKEWTERYAQNIV